MAFDYIRGILRPDGRVCVEYQPTGAEEPNQVLSPEGEDLSDLTDQEIIERLKGLSEDFNDPDYDKITIERSWYDNEKKITE